MIELEADAVADKVGLLLEGGVRTRRAIVSPEGVALPVELATFGERAIAFAIDVVIQSIIAGLVILAAVLLPLAHLPLSVTWPIALLIGFFVRNFYFIWFELAWLGSTPGKRMNGLRVVDRRGAPLAPMAAVARNLTREIETFIPLGLLMPPFGTGAAGWERLCLGLWMLLFALLPLFNRDRLRAGDLIAGTLVIALPRRKLMRELAEGDFHYGFADAQLRVYGAFELQVLEELLRRAPGPDSHRLRREVCAKIVRRIGWPEPIRDANTDLFLTDFYTAERAFLERERLFGRG